MFIYISQFSPFMYKFSLFILPLLFLLSCNGEEDTDTSRSDNATTGRTLTYTSQVHFLANPEAEEPISTIEVAIAESQVARQEGLMNVYDMPQDNGMIFIFEQEEQLSFWMANTPLSLDIIFVNADKEIVRIHSNTPPHSQQQFTSDQPAMYAVEVNAGYTARHDIQEGHFIEFVR